MLHAWSKINPKCMFPINKSSFQMAPLSCYRTFFSILCLHSFSLSNHHSICLDMDMGTWRN